LSLQFALTVGNSDVRGYAVWNFTREARLVLFMNTTLHSRQYLKAWPTVYTNHARIIIISAIQLIYFV